MGRSCNMHRDKRNARRVLVGEPETGPLGKYRRRIAG
jgi:hypothetical protein